MPRVVGILIGALVVAWIISNPAGAGDTVHHVLTSIGQFLSHSSGGTGTP